MTMLATVKSVGALFALLILLAVGAVVVLGIMVWQAVENMARA